MSIAYAMLVNGKRKHIKELFEYIYHPDAFFVFHVDSKAEPETHHFVDKIAETFKNVIFIESRNCSWGSYSLVGTTIDIVQAALQLSNDWNHCVIVSESHIPLKSPDELLNTLKEGCSYSEAFKVSEHSNTRLREEVYNRFRMVCRELPGIGSFGGELRNMQEDWYANIYHGSQWMAFSKEFCKFIVKESNYPGILEPFRTSLVPDENALQTLLLNNPSYSKEIISSPVTTSVCYREANLIFDKRAFNEAKDFGNMFIRKRPNVLDDDIRMYLEENSILKNFNINTHHKKVSILCNNHTDSIVDGDKKLSEFLRFIKHSSLTITKNTNSDPGQCIVLNISDDTWRKDIYLYIVSGDGCNFKICVVLDIEINKYRFNYYLLNNIRTSVLHIRHPDLYFKRELHIDIPNHGYFSLGDKNSYERAKSMLEKSFDIISEL